jgi:hypothetical protein
MRGTHTHGAGRITAAVLGAPVAAILATVAAAAGLPFDSDVRLLVAELATIPLMVVGACAALLSQSGLRAWAGCACVSALAAVVLVLVR